MTETAQDEAPAAAEDAAAVPQAVEPDEGDLDEGLEGETLADPEQGDEPEQGDGDEPEPNAEFQGPSVEEIEKMSKRLDGEATRHRNRISEIMGEMAQVLVPCELCDPQTAGFHLPADSLQPENDLEARLVEVLKTPSAPEYLLAGHVRRCAACDGWGAVLSGSRVAGKERVKCPTCGGQGFQGQGVVPEQANTSNGVVAVEIPDDAKPLVTDDADVWGSPRLLPDGQENPNYGKMPQYKQPGLP